MIARVFTVAFQGIDCLPIEVQAQLANGLPAFTLVGLPDKAVAESRERVRAALTALGLSLPAKRITVNLAPADLQKEGSHFDLPIAMALLVAMGLLPGDEIAGFTALGELGLDGSLAPVTGVLAASIAASAEDRGIICPAAQGGEAAWSGGQVLAPASLLALINHFKGGSILLPPRPELAPPEISRLDLKDIKGQESAKRALEVAAAGGHNLLMIGPPGSGKSMLAARLPGLLPPLSPAEALEVGMIHSVAGLLDGGRLLKARPFRDPHHSASMAAMIGGGARARPGDVSLAHKGVLVLDELPEFSAQALDSLRAPLETGEIMVARANAHIRYPARVQLVAAMNPCRCGLGGAGRGACGKAPRCQSQYQSRISGPLMDRIDLQVEVGAVTAADLSLPPPVEGTAQVRARVAAAREIQAERQAGVNALAEGGALEKIAAVDDAGRALLTRAAEAGGLSARGWARTLRLARTIADLEGSDALRRSHIAEALIYRRVSIAQPFAAAANA